MGEPDFTDEDMLMARRVYYAVASDYGSMEAAAKVVAVFRRRIEERVAAALSAAADLL